MADRHDIDRSPTLDPSPDSATSDRLRHDIDAGRTGDKVDAVDPAAAPLGTDDEAAGTPPSRQRVKAAFATAPQAAPAGRFGGWPLAAMAGAGAAVAAAAIFGAF